MASAKQYQMEFLMGARLNGNFGAAFTKAQQEFARLGREIQAVQAVQNNISTYEKQQKAVETTGAKLQNLQQRYALLQKEIQETAGSTAGLEREKLRLEQQISNTSAALEQQKKRLAQSTEYLKQAGLNTELLAQKSEELTAREKELKDAQLKAAEAAKTFGERTAEGAAMAQQALVSAGLTAGVKAVTDVLIQSGKAAMEYETAMAGVRRTVGGSEASIAAMGEGFRDLSTDIPITTTELGKIAETAGQLGIAQEAVSGFTEVMAQLSTTTDLTADTAATMLAQFSNITGTTDYERLGSAVAFMGDSTATTASKVVEMSQGLAAAANLAGMAETDILAIAAAVGSLGIEAQAGSTAISTLISTLHKAVETGNGLTDFASVAGMTAAEFKTAWGRDAVGAMDAFIQGLNDTERNGRSAVVILDELGITNVRQTKAILGLASAGDLLSGAIRQANNAWAENTALQEKAGIMYGTTESRLVMMQNAGRNLGITIGEQFTPELRALIDAGTGALELMTDFVQEHPAVVKGVLSFVTVAGSAAAAITAISAAGKALKLLDLAAVFAGPGGAAILAATAIGGIAAAVAGIAIEAGKGIPALKDLTEAAQDMGNVLTDSARAYDDSAASILASANLADVYIDRLDALGGGMNRTAEAQQEYHNTLALLCQTVPDLAKYIDLENDSITGGTAALRANTDAWKENAMAQAMQERLKALYAAQADVLIEVEKNRLKLTEAQAKAEEIERRRTETLARMNALSREAQRNGESLPKEYYALQDSLVDLGREYQTAEKNVRTYETALAEGGEAAVSAEAEITLATEAVENLSGALADSSGAEAQAGALAEIEDAIAPVRSEVELLRAAYQEAYDSALDSIAGQYRIWDQAAKVIPTSADKINKALESQVKYWENYNANLQTILDNAGEIEGLNEMLASLDPGDKNTVNFVAGLAQAAKNDKQTLKDMVSNWQEAQKAQQEAAGSFADYVTEFSGQMDGLQQTFAETIQNMSLADEAAEAARETIQAFIDQAGGMSGSVRAAYARLGQAALDALAGGPGAVPAGEPAAAKRRRGYASGTSNAEPGWAMVGENGPEMMFFRGGERVLTAAETARRVEPLRALPLPVSGTPSVQLQINVGGNAGPETVAALREQGTDIVQQVLDALDARNADARRRVY